MIIAVDIDNVLFPFIEGFVDFANKNLGHRVSLDEIKSNRLWTHFGTNEGNQWELIFKYYSSPFFDDISTVLGAKEAIEKLSKEHKLIAITGRPEETREKTMAYLGRNFPDMIQEVCFTNSHVDENHPDRRTKSYFCNLYGADIIVDDDHQFANECAEQGITTIYFKTPFNETDRRHDSLIVADGWDHVMDIIEGFSEPDRQRAFEKTT